MPTPEQRFATKDDLKSLARSAHGTYAYGVKGSAEGSWRTGQVSISKSDIGLGSVEDKSSADIRGELTLSDVAAALEGVTWRDLGSPSYEEEMPIVIPDTGGGE